MRRWMVYVLAVAALLLLRQRGASDVGALLPVELLYIEEERGTLWVRTDTGNFGFGEDLPEALENLKATAAGDIFLETADYLIVTPETTGLVEELAEILRPATEVCVGVGVDTQAAKYLKAHPTGVTLKQIRAGTQWLPILRGGEGRYWYEQGNGLRKKI